MIQRIQSIYLFFAALMIFGLYFFPLAHDVFISGMPTTIKVTGLFQHVNGQIVHTQVFTALTAVTGIVALVPLVVIFLYKNRKQQINFCYVAILFIIAYSFWMSQTVKAAAEDLILGTNNFGVGLFLTSISLFLMIMAIKAIQRDDKLVKSADRLR